MSVRPYVQKARAEASTRTRTSVLDAAMSLGLEKATADVSLADVADRSGVSVQTVLRHFGTRDALIDEAIHYGAERIAAERRPASPDAPAAIAALFDHYEKYGDAVITLLAQETFDQRIAAITARGRSVHSQWVTQMLTAVMEPAEADDGLIDQVVIVTDVYAWRILRRDRGLPRAVAQDRVLGMVEAMLAAARPVRREPT